MVDSWEVVDIDLSIFRPVCVTCGFVIVEGGFGIDIDGTLHCSCARCMRRTH